MTSWSVFDTEPVQKIGSWKLPLVRPLPWSPIPQDILKSHTTRHKTITLNVKITSSNVVRYVMWVNGTNIRRRKFVRQKLCWQWVATPNHLSYLSSHNEDRTGCKGVNRDSLCEIVNTAVCSYDTIRQYTITTHEMDLIKWEYSKGGVKQYDTAIQHSRLHPAFGF